MRRLLYALPVALFLVLAVYFALALRPGYDPQTLPSAMIGKPVPTIDLVAFDGGTHLTNAAFAGQVVLINFFASWCIPCRAEHPTLMHLADDQKIPIFGIDYKDKPEDARRFIGQLGDPFRRIGFDSDGQLGLQFGVYGVPETYVVDKTGRIRFRQVAPITPAALDTQIMPLIKKLEAS